MSRPVMISDELLEEIKTVTGVADETAAVEQALLRVLATRRVRPLDGMLELAGQDLLRDDYDYKAMRQGHGDDH